MLLVVCLPLRPVHAQGSVETWVSAAKGDDSHICDQASPCRSFAGAITKTADGGRISVLDPGSYGPVLITKSISIVNDSGGTATTSFGYFQGSSGAKGQIVIDAPSTGGSVTLRGLTIDPMAAPGVSGMAIESAQQVNVETCTILNAGAPGLFMGLHGNLNGSTANVNVQDTTINASAAGIKVLSVPGLAVAVSVHNAQIKNNLGAGIRADGSGGGTITVQVSDSDISLNASNGVLALGGPGSATVNVTRSIIASNSLFGVQSNQTSGGTASVAVEGSKILNNGSGQVGFFGGGTLLSAGNNLLVGPNGSGFTGPITLQ